MLWLNWNTSKRRAKLKYKINAEFHVAYHYYIIALLQFIPINLLWSKNNQLLEIEKSQPGLFV
jgi:hypothetical protein